MSRSMRPLSRRLISLQCRRFESTTSVDKPKHSREEVLEFLREQDDVYLAASKRKVERIEQQAREIKDLARQYNERGGAIQYDHSIPVYRTAFWKKKRHDYELIIGKMLKQTERIRLNLTDLETVNYPSDSDFGSGSAGVATLGKQDRDKMLLQTRSEKEKALWDLRSEEAAHRRRFETALDTFEKAVEKYNLQNTKTPMPAQFGMERKSLKENVNKARDESRSPEKKEGWGSSSTRSESTSIASPVPAKTTNPFMAKRPSSSSPEDAEHEDRLSLNKKVKGDSILHNPKEEKAASIPRVEARTKTGHDMGEAETETQAQQSPVKNRLLDLQKKLESSRR